MREVEPFFGADQIRIRVSELAAEIRRDAGDDPICLIGILKGASVFLTDVLLASSGVVRYEWVNVIRDHADTETAEAMEIDFLTQFDMRGKRLYVLKDVVSTGVIESYLLSQFRQNRPSILKLVALIDIPEARTVDLVPDFAAFTAPKSLFVGYGLEYEGEYGNLPFIGTL
jgi:hypoxanthine phosphoribosyltransferase